MVVGRGRRRTVLVVVIVAMTVVMAEVESVVEKEEEDGEKDFITVGYAGRRKSAQETRDGHSFRRPGGEETRTKQRSYTYDKT